MKKLLVAATAAAAFCGAPALAADMPVKAPPMAAAPYDPWTGCYIGLNTGYGWGHKTTTETIVEVPIPPVNIGKTNVDGWLYGGQLGCDYHIAATSWIVGARVMWDGTGMKGTNEFTNSPGFLNAIPGFNEYKIRSFGTAVVKVGALLNPNVELYGLAGLAWVRDNLTQGAPTVAGVNFAVGSWDKAGYDVGVGLTWMFAPSWDLFIEYDHMGFGTKHASLQGVGVEAGLPLGADVKQNIDKILVGIDYRFSGR
jgi:outer membrane immunogenic protein